jgi:two-component system sensor histidine kinase UhpB
MALSMLAGAPARAAGLVEKAAYLDAWSTAPSRRCTASRSTCGRRRSTSGIVAALEWQAREFEKQGHRLHLPQRRQGHRGRLDPDHASALFRIFQEALTNIAKHAGATRVTVTLRRQRQHLTLTICDNGRGIAPADRLKPQSFGLRGMSERARALGGTLTLSAAPGGGTMVAIKIRLAPPPAAAPSQPEPREQ